MECLSSLILLLASQSDPTGSPIILVLILISWQIKNLRPCALCAVIMYAILIGVLLFEDRGDDEGLFSALRLSPKYMELNLLLRVKYDPIMGLCRKDIK